MYRFFRLFLGLLCAAGLLAAGSAQALTLTIDSASTNAGNTPDQTFNSCTAGGWSCDEDNGQFASVVNVSDAGGIAADEAFNSVDAGVTYQSILSADTSWDPVTHNVDSDYNITLTVSADPGTIYEVLVWTSKEGELVTNDETWGAWNPAANTSEVVGVANLVEDMGSLSFADPTTGITGENLSEPIFGSSETWMKSGLSGNTVLTMDFSWTQTATSEDSEGCVRLGLAGDLGGVDCDTANGSYGHKVYIVAQVVSVIPEPGTFALLSLGLLGLAVYSRRMS